MFFASNQEAIAVSSDSLADAKSGTPASSVGVTVMERQPIRLRAVVAGASPDRYRSSTTSTREECARPCSTCGAAPPRVGRMSTTDQPVNANKALWEKGDFTRIAAAMRESGDALIERIGVTSDMDVLDLGSGDGTTAVPSAQRGANVLGVDIASNLVAAGNARAQSLGLTNLRFQEGDASDLNGLADDSFDLVVSIFGAMFAPKPFDVAKEMVRVTRPGGRIVMGNWIAGDPTFVAQLLRISGAYSPPPPEGFISPVTWGVEENVVERFGAAGIPAERISCERDTYLFTFNG